MLSLIASLDNYVILPSPVLDESPQGFHTEDRLQVTAKSPVNDQAFTIEFRLGEGSDAPTTQQLETWMEAGDLVRITCTSLTARPFTHQEGKQYRSRGSEREINGKAVVLDTLIVFAGQRIVLASDPFEVEAEIRQARGAYKKQQRSYRETTNARRVEEAKAGMADRVAKLKAAQAKRTAAAAEPASVAAEPAAAGTPDSVARKR